MKKASDYADAHLRVFERSTVSSSDQIDTVYLVGICGTGMGALAGLFREAGFSVAGSDANAYPPMSTRLRDSGIRVIEGYRAENLDYGPDLTIVGNACTPTHPEAARARDERMPQLSFPEAFAEFFIGARRSLVVAGTHGKTTTTGLLAHTFVTADLDPTFLVGGVLLNGDTSFRCGGGNYSIVEGDEYDSCYFDKRPKFMLYRPTSAIVTSLELDHTDIYEDWEDYRKAFEQFVSILPSEGHLILNADDEAVVKLATFTDASVLTYGISAAADVSATDIVFGDTGISFKLVTPGNAPFQMLLPVTGRHNLSNALAVAAQAWAEHVPLEVVRQAFATFKGLKRRQEIIEHVNDVIVVDDFAHHPTAVAATIDGVRERWPARRIVAVFEPRSNSSRRKVFERQYAAAFERAHVAIISSPPFRHNDNADDFMDVAAICSSLADRGVDAFAASDHASLRKRIGETLQRGDIVLIMSNGGFGGLHDWITTELHRKRAGTLEAVVDDDLLGRATALCKASIVVDGHIDVPHRLIKNPAEDISQRTATGDFDFVRAREGGLDAAFMAAYVPAELQGTGSEKAYTDGMIDRVSRICDAHPDKFARAGSPHEVRSNREKGLVSLPLAIENGAALMGDVGNVAYFFARGVRYMTLTHGEFNTICDSSYDTRRQWGGVSPFGADVIREMNRVGMMVDVSHTSDQAFVDVLRLSSQPVLATHSSMRHFTPGWERNISDEMLIALAEADGLVLICFGSSFLRGRFRAEADDLRERMRADLESRNIPEDSEAGRAIVADTRARNPLGTVADVVLHIRHAVKLVGIDHVGLGSDFDGVFSLPRGLQDVSGYPNLVAELLRVGFTEEAIRKILGENFLQFWARTIAAASA